jgi:hemolysin activation/secretion protein
VKSFTQYRDFLLTRALPFFIIGLKREGILPEPGEFTIRPAYPWPWAMKKKHAYFFSCVMAAHRVRRFLAGGPRSILRMEHLMRSILSLLAGILLLSSICAFAAGEKPDDAPRFDISRFQVEGNRLLDKAHIDRLLVPFTGHARDFGTVQEALEALENAYRDRGFSMVSVTLPEQELEKGVIRLQVHENRIGRIKISGLRYYDTMNIRSSLPDLREGETPNVNAISRSLKQANESPAKKVALQFANSDRENEIDANLEVKDERPWKIGLTGDNTGTKDTGPTRLGILAQHANVFNRDHLLTLQYITSPEKLDKVSIYSMGYRAPFYAWGSSLEVFGAHSNVDSGTISAASFDMNVSGKGTILGVRYNQNLTRIHEYEHKLSLGLDYRSYENNVTLQGIQLGNNVTVHPVNLTYSGSWSKEPGKAGFYLTVVQNLPGNWDGRDHQADFERVRADASRGYTILRYGANVLYAVGGDWQVRAVFNGQHTSDQLVPGEQFGIGGANSVRGFREREIANDQGYSGSAEVYSPDLFKLFGIPSVQSRLLFFYDRGEVSRNRPLPGETINTVIASIGPGIRITDGKRFNVSADLGFVLNPPDANTSKWSQIWHLSGSVLF